MNNRPKREVFLPDGKTKTYYWLIGDSSNPPLLLLPGFTGTHSDLLPLANLLKQKYYVILPDLPGWGESEIIDENLTIKFYSEFIKLLLEHIKLKQVTLVGHCMGASLAIEFANSFPELVKKLILISTPYLEGTLHHSIFLHLAGISSRSPKFLRRVFFFWRSRVFSIPLGLLIFLKYRSFRKKMRSTFKNLHEQPKQNEEAVEENWISLINFDYNKLKRLKVPTYLIHGSQDLVIPISQAIKLKEQLIPQASLEFISRAGHLPPLEAPQSLASMILKYP